MNFFKKVIEMLDELMTMEFPHDDEETLMIMVAFARG